MARKKRNIEDNRPKIKVRLDGNTIITIRDMKALDIWLPKFPNLRVLPA